MRKNVFIAFEGIDGSGKTTQVKMLAQRLMESGHKVHATSEPTDSPIGKMIRSVFRHDMKADHRTIAGLFVADRLHHLLNETDGIMKKLEEGYTVITDRYYFSSYAYHSVHMPMQWVIESNAMSASILRPDLNVFIDVTPENAMKRIQAGRDSREMYETLENLTQVRAKYFEAFEKMKGEEKVALIDGNRSSDAVARDVMEALASMQQPIS
jgi:dTMP kinase